jgi:hypothetical protein
VALARNRLFVAPDAQGVSVAELRSGLGGRHLQSFARRPLSPGALVPSSSGQNLQRPDELRAALRAALDSLGSASAACTLVLPDGVGRLALLTAGAGVDLGELVRFRLAGSLPFPSSDAMVDLLPAGAGRVVGVALRRGTVAEYEQAILSQGLAIGRVHLSPLLSLSALVRRAARNGVEVVLGDVAACFAVLRRGALLALRSRRRDRSPGEADRLLRDAEREARAALDGDGGRGVGLVGSDAVRLRVEAGIEGHPSLPQVDGVRWPEAAEAAWLGGLLS